MRTILLSHRSQFTGKERDSETGLDYFGARYYASSIGRFTSVDPITVTKQRMLNPQALNLYAYTLNNALRYVDPDGRDAALSNDTEEGRKKALYKITKNLTVPEQRNIAYRKDANGKYQLYIKDASKIDSSKASAGYKYLTNLINDHSVQANYGLVGGGLSATMSDGTRVSSYGQGGVTFGCQGCQIDVIVQHGNYAPGVKAFTASGRETTVEQPDFITTAHELFGETYKYTAGHHNLQMDPVRDGKTAIDIENQIRAFHGLPLRTGSDHGNIVTVTP